MQVLFTKGTSILSRAIRKASGEDCSHVALRFTDSLVIHSNLLGIHINSYAYFQTQCEIMHRVDVPDQEGIADKLLKYEGQGYDFLALIWLFLMAIYPLRKINQWQDSKKFTCTEFVTEVVLGEADSVITPHGLFMKLSKEEI